MILDKIRYSCLLWIIFYFYVLKYSLCDSNKGAADRCFCELRGDVDDCGCAVEALHTFNIYKIYPRIKSLLEADYFRYFKVNLNRKCPFWVDDSKCSMKDCHVTGCGEDELPKGLRSNQNVIDHEKDKYFEKQNGDSSEEACKDENRGGLGNLDTTISKESQAAIENWTLHDDQQDNFCELDDDKSGLMQHVDLLKNPERFTGYDGPSAHRIWNSIYNENCFNEPNKKFPSGFKKAANQCLEKRVFYRLISGLHTSINLHLCRHYLLKDTNHFDPTGKQVWGPNSKEFVRRFDPRHEPQGPQRLKNLYFTYLVQMRALAKAAPYLRTELFFTGTSEADMETKVVINELLDLISGFEHHFDEKQLFRGHHLEMNALKQAYRVHFRNISRIMDCVGCDKCKLWGKLQTQGMGTALKILFSHDSPTNISAPKTSFQLRRTEIVALFNAFGKFSESIQSIDKFRDILKQNEDL